MLSKILKTLKSLMVCTPDGFKGFLGFKFLRMKTSDQVILKISKGWITKQELAKELGISKPTLNSRLKDNCFTVSDIMNFRRLKLIK